MKFKIGDITTQVWAGDLVHDCVFLAYLDNGGMLFYDLASEVFRYAFWQAEENGKFTLNGWKYNKNPAKLINN